jgi:hypothetical protein
MAEMLGKAGNGRPRASARFCRRQPLGEFALHLAEIAHKALDNPGWGLAAVARDLKAAVADDVGAA